MTRKLFFLLLIALPLAGMAKEVVGWVERARVHPGDVEFRARIDTGAKTSSLDVDSMDYFDRDGAQWVRFSTVNREGKVLQLERPLHRTVRIKRDQGTLKERPVIILGICLAGVYREAELNLENRKHLNYKMLIGRSFLNGDFLVDPGSVFINPPRCELGRPDTGH